MAYGAIDLHTKHSQIRIVTADGAVVFDQKSIGVSGVRPLVKRKTQKDAEVPVIIQADESAPVGVFARVLDEAKLGGAKNVSLATEQ